MADRSPSVNVLGTKIAPLNMRSSVDLVEGWVNEETDGRYVCVTGVHGVMEGLRDQGVRHAHNSADACVPDGMPMTWVGRIRGHGAMNRVYGPDLMLELLALSARRGYSNYLYGGAEGVADNLAVAMERRFAGLRVVGTFCPPFRPLRRDEKQAVVADVNACKPDLFWVGLSTPKQELFMHEFRQLLSCKVMVGVGAAFDFHTGRVRQAPRWMMRSGLEWFFRLCMEPRRLGPRYLRNNPAFLWHIALQLSGLQQYPIDKAPQI